MSIFGYLEKKWERQEAMKELGKGYLKSEKENYEDKVNTVVDTMASMYDNGDVKFKDHVDNTIEEIRDAKYDKLVACVGTGIALGATALSVLSDMPADVLTTIASSTLAVICMVEQVKANNRAKRAEKELRSVFSETVTEDQQLGIVYTRHAAEKHGFPFYFGVSHATRDICLSDACDEFVACKDELCM